MELYERLCKNCGGDLHETDDGRFKCAFCGSIFEGEAVKDYADEMRKLFDEIKLEAISNARRNLYEAVNAEYVSSTHIHECCLILKQLLPDDFQANFYDIAVGNNLRAVTKAIRKIKIDKDTTDIESVIKFLIRSLQTEFQLELNNLIARAFEYSDPVKFEYYCTYLADEVVKTDSGVYETKLPREVFVAYSSKDMDKVSELVEVLEAQGLKCFVAARNLRHGKGAVEHYNAALEEAMDHCRSIVFVSSTNSRSFNCDALTIELPYVQKKDIENAPTEYRNNYKGIPLQYKKPRVEYRIGESAMVTAADTISNEIFDGYERAYTPDEVAARVMKQLLAAPTKVEAATEPKAEPKKVKYCVSCLLECDADSKFCSGCAGNEFADTFKEAELMQQISRMNEDNAAHAPIAESIPAGLEFKKQKNEYIVSNGETCVGNVRIPASYNSLPVTKIGDRAFWDCSNIKSITIPDSVTAIGEMAFYNCSSLTSITIPSSVTCIGYDAFANCSSLTSVYISDITAWCHTCFYHVYSNPLYHANDLYLNGELVTNLIIPDSVTSVYDGAFFYCSRLTSITIPDSVTTIGDRAFEGCSRLTSITIPDSVTHIGDSAFFGCLSLTSITIPDSVTSIGCSAFSNCSNLTSITIPDSVTSIGDNAFSGCSSLTSITIPDMVTSIGKEAFLKCASLTSITIPDRVTSIGDNAFSGCSNLVSITISKNVTKINSFVSIFGGSTKIKKVIFENSKGWRKAGGGLFSKIPEKILADPQKAAEALKTKYADVAIERK